MAVRSRSRPRRAPLNTAVDYLAAESERAKADSDVMACLRALTGGHRGPAPRAPGGLPALTAIAAIYDEASAPSDTDWAEILLLSTLIILLSFWQYSWPRCVVPGKETRSQVLSQVSTVAGVDVGRMLRWVLVATTAMAGCGTSTSAKRSSPTVTGTPEASRPTNLIELDAVSAESVWAETFDPQSGSRQILKSADGGKRWVLVTPRLAKGLASRTTDFLNGDDTWLVVAPPHDPTPKTATVWATSDGGTAWHDLGSLPPPCY